MTVPDDVLLALVASGLLASATMTVVQAKRDRRWSAGFFVILAAFQAMVLGVFIGKVVG